MGNMTPLDKTSFGAVKDDRQGEMDTTESLGGVLASTRTTDLSRKVLVTVYRLKVDKEFNNPYREEVPKVVALRTLYRWYKAMTGEVFTRASFKERIENQSALRRDVAIHSFKGRIDSGLVKPIK